MCLGFSVVWKRCEYNTQNQSFVILNPSGFLYAQNSNITDNLVGSNGTLLGWGGGVYVADHCTNGVCGLVTATLTNNLIDMNHAHQACEPPIAYLLQL